MYIYMYIYVYVYVYVYVRVCVFMYASTCMSLNGCVCTHRCTRKYIYLSLPVSFTENISPRVCVYIVCRAEPPDRKPNIEHI